MTYTSGSMGGMCRGGMSGMPDGGTGRMAAKFDAAMQSEGGGMSGAGMSRGGMGGLSGGGAEACGGTGAAAGGAGAAGGDAGGMSEILDQIKQMMQQFSQLIQSMSAGNSSGGSTSGGGGGVTPAEGSGGSLGGTQGPSDKIPDPTENIREIKLGAKTMTIGSDGSASKAEVDAAGAEMQRMYDSSPTFRKTIDGASGNELTVTMGRRGDNTSWGGGNRVFLNVNNIEAGNNDTFQGLVGHEFAHAAAGLPHGAQLDAIEARVRAEA